MFNIDKNLRNNQIRSSTCFTPDLRNTIKNNSFFCRFCKMTILFIYNLHSIPNL